MIKINILELLEKENKSKYWLCKNMNITFNSINRIIRRETTSISFKYIEELCNLLNCEPGDLITIERPVKEKENEYL